MIGGPWNYIYNRKILNTDLSIVRKTKEEQSTWDWPWGAFFLLQCPGSSSRPGLTAPSLWSTAMPGCRQCLWACEGPGREGQVSLTTANPGGDRHSGIVTCVGGRHGLCWCTCASHSAWAGWGSQDWCLMNCMEAQCSFTLWLLMHCWPSGGMHTDTTMCCCHLLVTQKDRVVQM